ncbi:gamma-glutamylcyclotransferase-like protein [Dinothrombium tinctorium]|uniref:gamma-glutamylcyclotransferase n=1 Tax=Dinothrombium tinctorium TaxID=1965070 RepID=A0A443RQY0_9ACAR|nr:gamma-glutamylcyclotransferase-like protein [Dinothrombium tinctorium]
MKEDTVNYFAYGSNLLTSRIRIRNKSAVKVCIGRLNDYYLTFNGYSNTWKGGTANIVPRANSFVIGVVWRIAQTDVTQLDAQEVGYRPVAVNVCTDDGSVLECRTYVQLNGCEHEQHSCADPCFVAPSAAYKRVVLMGGEEHGLDAEYLDSIRRMPDNGVNECSLSHLFDSNVSNTV